MQLLQELRRRKVFRLAALYIVSAWIVLQVADLAFESWEIASSALRFVWLAAVLGFPIALIFGWRYDITAKGIVRTPPADASAEIDLSLHRKDFLILSLLVAVAAVVVYQFAMKVIDTPSVPTDDTTSNLHGPISIAVMPLDNLSGDPEQAYFVNGIHEALISDLSRISAFRVTSKITARTYERKGKPISTICEELAVSRIVEGGVLRAGNDVRVDVRLIDCSDQQTAWSSAYDRELKDVLIMQAEITRSIANAVQIALTPAETELLARTGDVDPAAFESYLRGMFHLEMITPQSMKLAEELFARALEFDRNSALAYWGLGRACRFQMQFGMGLPVEREPECRGQQFKALSINPDLPQVHLGLALSYWLYDYDWEAADVSFSRAIELNPNYAEAYMFYSHFLAHVLRWEHSEASITRAVELDPLNTFVLGLHAAQQHLTGRDRQAIAMLSQIHREVPGFGFGYDVLWSANFRLNDLDAAVAAAERHFSVTMGLPGVTEGIEANYADGGFDGAMLGLATRLEALAEQQYVQAVFIAFPYAMTGNAEKAITWLEKAFEQHDPQMPYVGTLGAFHKIMNNPGYRRILERMNLSAPEE